MLTALGKSSVFSRQSITMGLAIEKSKPITISFTVRDAFPLPLTLINGTASIFPSFVTLVVTVWYSSSLYQNGSIKKGMLKSNLCIPCFVNSIPSKIAAFRYFPFNSNVPDPCSQESTSLILALFSKVQGTSFDTSL